MKILILPKYTSEGASSRYRFFQYIEYFKHHNIIIEVDSFFKDGYVAFLNTGNRVPLSYILHSYIHRFIKVFIHSSKFDIIYFQAELFPYMPAWAEWFLKNIFRKKLIVDYDDAIFHNYDLANNFLVKKLLASKIKKVINICDFVITGSPYLTHYASLYNKSIEEIPTSIEYKKFLNNSESTEENDFIIGWIGSSSTSKYVLQIKDALEKFLNLYPSSKLHLIGFNKNQQILLQNPNVKFIDWSSEDEIAQMNLFSVGIMPLAETPWEKGKCGFKLIQYMACGKPTISTPLEANVKINKNLLNLFASSQEEWFYQLEKIYINKDYYKSVGKKNKIIVSDYYSVETNYQTYMTIFNSVFLIK